MERGRNKCIFLISSKSSGSSALQNLVSKSNSVNHIKKTRHRENETLYWVKAASILGMPQSPMLDSEVPIKQSKARRELVHFLKENLTSFDLPVDDRHLIFGGWEALCNRYGPVFFEKSPHHLHQWSALELINQCVDECPSVDFLVVGLVRNPMDTIYSRWSGGRSIPEKYQFEWFNAYNNLLKFSKISKAKFVMIRYEDMVKDVAALNVVYKFIGKGDQADNNYLHSRSVSKWRKDRNYGFQLADQVLELGLKFGYDVCDMTNTPKRTWFLHRGVTKARYELAKPFYRTARIVRSSLKAK